MKTKYILIYFIIAVCAIKSNAQVWSAVGAGLNGTVNAMYNDTASNRLYATGAFTGKVAYWNGTIWTVIPGFPGNYAGLTVCTHGGNLFVGSDSIYKYNGSTWSTIQGFGTSGVSSLMSFGYGIKQSCWYPPSAQNGMNDYLYFCGYLSTGQTTLIRLDPTNNYSATAVAKCGAQQVGDMKVYNGTMYISGYFATWTFPALVISNNIIKYTTNLVQAVITSTTASSAPWAAVYNNDIYFSGSFIGYNGVSSSQFIKYNANFVATGGNAGAGVMQAYSGNLYEAKGIAPGMSIWNGASFSNIPSPIGQSVYCLAVYNGELYAGGTFTTPYSNIAKYNANPLLVVSATATNVSCNGGSNGSATCTPTGGLPSYTYSWTPGSYTTAAVSGLTAGTYTVKVVDASTMVKTATVVITQPSAVIANQFQTNVSCNSGSNASATVVASGGTPGYTYSWSPTGGTSSTASGFSQGAYSCVIKDANNCTITKNFNITQPNVLTATGTQTNETSPSSNDGIAVVNPTGGTPGYSYSWSPTGGSAQTASGLTGGTYTCLITDAHGCTTTQNFTITTGMATGVNTNIKTLNFNIYPNPCTDKLIIEYPGYYIVNVFDCIGQKVRTITVNSKSQVELGEQGIYFIEVITNEGKRTVNKIIKQ